MCKVVITYDATCKHCKYLLRTQPRKRVMHKCAVDGHDIVLKTPACKNFKL
jgi:hypothetical protein